VPHGDPGYSKDKILAVACTMVLCSTVAIFAPIAGAVLVKAMGTALVAPLVGTELAEKFTAVGEKVLDVAEDIYVHVTHHSLDHKLQHTEDEKSSRLNGHFVRIIHKCLEEAVTHILQREGLNNAERQTLEDVRRALAAFRSKEGLQRFGERLERFWKLDAPTGQEASMQLVSELLAADGPDQVLAKSLKPFLTVQAGAGPSLTVHGAIADKVLDEFSKRLAPEVFHALVVQEQTKTRWDIAVHRLLYLASKQTNQGIETLSRQVDELKLLISTLTELYSLSDSLREPTIKILTFAESHQQDLNQVLLLIQTSSLRLDEIFSAISNSDLKLDQILTYARQHSIKMDDLLSSMASGNRAVLTGISSISAGVSSIKGDLANHMRQQQEILAAIRSMKTQGA